MRRFTILIALLALTVMQMAAQDTSIKGTITLSHQGKGTDFAYNKMTDAIDAAVDGDTLYLSAGYFEGDFVLDKKLVFIGSGANSDNGWGNCTYYGTNNKIVIKLPENTKLTARLFEGINFGYNSFYYQTAIENVVFKKCNVCSYNLTIQADIKSILFDRCNIQGSGYHQSNTKKIIARNCRISDLDIDRNNGSGESSWQFVNCTIRLLSHYGGTDNDGNDYNFCPIYRGNFVNCIISNGDYYNKTGFTLYDPESTDTKSSASFTNCLFYKPIEGKDIFNGATVQNDMYFDATGLENNWNIDDFTKERLQENNFLGNDGTVVGCYGGKNPYSLKIAQPTITSSKVHFDRDQKQIQIKMKVSSEQ